MPLIVRHIGLLSMLLAFQLGIAQRADPVILDSIAKSYQRALSFKHLAKYDKAFGHLETGLGLANSLSAKEKTAYGYYLITDLNIERNNIQEAREYLLEALSLQRDSEAYANYMLTLLASANIHLKLDDIGQAEAAIAEAQAVATERDITVHQDRLAFMKAKVAAEKGNFESTLLLINELLPYSDALEKNYMHLKALNLSCSANLALGNNTEALLNAREILKLSRVYNYAAFEVSSLKKISEISLLRDDFQTAYQFLDQHYRVKDSAFTERNIANEILQREKFDNTYAERRMAEMEKEQNLRDKDYKNQKIYSLLSSALLIIISLLAISLYRNNQIKIKTNALLVKKNSELQIAKENAEKAMNAKAQFLSTVSHELRTPLYAVTGLTHLLLEENPSEHQKEHLKSLKFSGDYLLAFINDILQINKIDAKRLTVKSDDFELEKILNDVVSSLSTTAKENGNKIVLDIDEAIPAHLVGDPLKLSQIFINLVGNALKFTENGEVRIVARTLHQNSNTYSIRFNVKDTGIGIPEEMQEAIFESFAQGSVQINRKYGGTGLGLTIVRSLLSLLNSEISLKSKVGKGSTFSFDITFGRSAKVTKDKDALISEDEFEKVLKKLHVLLVEDNKINQMITKKMMAKKGMTCDIANDGYEAIDMAKSNQYDLILMDIHMPGISGLKATEEIRKFDGLIPIIALTAISLDENTDDFYEVGCDDIVTKPFKPEVFYQKISKNILKNLKPI